MKLPLSYYEHDDVLFLGQDLLGKCIFTKIDNVLTCGIINETESYRAPDDRASHAYNMRRTARTEIMYAKGGHVYVYLCYGIHYLLNVVTNFKNIPHAILIRSIVPLIGIDAMKKRRGISKEYPDLSHGPARAAQALGIDRSFNGETLDSSRIWIEDYKIRPKEDDIEKLPRIGVEYAGPDAKLPWRFCLKNSYLETIVPTLQSMVRPQFMK